MLLCGVMIVLFPSAATASYSLGSDIHTYPEVLHTPLGPASVPETQNVDIGYGWIREIAPDGSSVISYSQQSSTDSSGDQTNRIDPRYAMAAPPQWVSSPNSQASQLPSAGSSLPSAPPPPSNTVPSSTKYLMPPGSKKSKAQVKCQTRYDPATGKWMVRYVVVFVMEPNDAKVQKVTKTGAIAYVDIDKKGRGMDVIK
jgi:hypothetical protein